MELGEPVDSAATRDTDVASLAKRMLRGSGRLHDLTNTIAEAIHKAEHPGHSWEHDRVKDQWLAVGTWRAAEAVIRVLPLVVKP